MSTYFNSLSLVDRQAYAAKLTLVNGVSLTDPYSISAAQWVHNHPTKWPPLQWPDIHDYLIETPSLYTREKLRAYKSLDAYNFVLCGHVQDIDFHDYKIEDFVVLKAEVLPSQRQGQKTQLYKSWVIINKRNCCVLTANCTCVAGYVLCIQLNFILIPSFIH